MYAESLETAAGISIKGYLGDQKHESMAGPITLKAVEIRNNASRGIDAQTDAPISAEGLVFGRNAGVSMRIAVDLAERLAPPATEPVELLGVQRTPVRLPLLVVPYVVVESLHVGGYLHKPLAVLTIQAGTTLKFKKETDLLVGGHFAGGIVAHGVTFTSAEPEPRAGDWRGITVHDNGTGDFSDDTFEYAGMDEWPVLVSSIGGRRGFDVRNSRFRRNAAPAFGDPLSCDKWRSADRRNVFEDQPRCVRNKK